MQRDSSPEPLPSQGANVPDAQGLAVLPAHRDLYYGGAWHRPLAGNYFALTSPGTGQSLGHAADASADDVDAAVRSTLEAFSLWRAVPPLERGGPGECARARAARRDRLWQPGSRHDGRRGGRGVAN